MLSQKQLKMINMLEFQSYKIHTIDKKLKTVKDRTLKWNNKQM